jgi:cell division protease FtsH
MLDVIVRALGGRVAEELILDDISTGASSDIQHATSIARNMVTRYGMSDKLGTVLYGSDHSSDEVFLGRDFSSGKNYSEQTAASIDDEIRSIISSSYDRCKTILTEHIDKLHFVAEFLLKNESMDEEQFKAAMESENPTIEEIEDIAFKKQKKSEEENQVAHENNAKAEEEERLRREELSKRMEAGESLSEELLNDVFGKSHIDPAPDKNEDTVSSDDDKSDSSDNT